MRRYVVVGIAGHIEHVQARTIVHQPFGKLATAHAAGHDHIGHEQIDLSLVFACDTKCHLTIGGLQHGVAPAAQDAARQLANRVGILDQQNRFCAGAMSRRLAWVGSLRFLLRVDARQVDAERSAFTQRALHRDVPAALRRNAEHRRQPQPGPVLFRREERLEQMRECLVIHALSGVLDLQYHVWPGINGSAEAGQCPRRRQLRRFEL